MKEKIGYDDIQKMIKVVLKNIKIGAERTTDIVKGLRTFSLSDTDQLVRIDVKQELEVALLLLNNRLKDKVQIIKKYDEQMRPIDGFKGQLGQVFLNIIGNAVDALEDVENPTITITTTLQKEKLKIEIMDNGPGIDTAHLDRIFDPFFTTKKVGDGTGLGLSIAYGIVERHKGKLSVSSKPGQGAIFTILLPLKIVG